jgi:hypothetical protein
MFLFKHQVYELITDWLTQRERFNLAAFNKFTFITYGRKTTEKITDSLMYYWLHN